MAARSVDVIIENHGGISSNPDAVTAVMTTMDMGKMMGVVAAEPNGIRA